MERKYREITLQRRNRKMKTMAGGFIVVLAVFCTKNLSQDFWEQILLMGTNCIQPAVVDFYGTEEEDEQQEVPFLIRFAAPSVFAYTWQEKEDEISVIGIERMDIEDEVLQTKTDLWKDSIDIKVSDNEALSLMQENLYMEKTTSVVQSGVPNPFQTDNTISFAQQNTQIIQNIDAGKYKDIAALIKDFYVVDASTAADGQLLDIDRLTSYDCTIDKQDSGPQILIYHSHSQEKFADSKEGVVSDTIVGAGEKLTALLQGYGYDVLHHTGIYDLPDRDDAYGRALPAVEQVLAENPTIQVVIDLHRDAVAEGTKLIHTIDGKDYARFMFFNGICRSTSGPITYLDNPYLEQNLAFSFQSQVIAESYFPGITRKIYLKAWRYNMHLRPKNMLIELGAQTNTVEEVMNTTEILAFIIDKVLSGQ